MLTLEGGKAGLRHPGPFQACSDSTLEGKKVTSPHWDTYQSPSGSADGEQTLGS